MHCGIPIFLARHCQRAPANFLVSKTLMNLTNENFTANGQSCPLHRPVVPLEWVQMEGGQQTQHQEEGSTIEIVGFPALPARADQMDMGTKEAGFDDLWTIATMTRIHPEPNKVLGTRIDPYRHGKRRVACLLNHLCLPVNPGLQPTPEQGVIEATRVAPQCGQKGLWIRISQTMLLTAAKKATAMVPPQATIGRVTSMNNPIGGGIILVRECREGEAAAQTPRKVFDLWIEPLFAEVWDDQSTYWRIPFRTLSSQPFINYKLGHKDSNILQGTQCALYPYGHRF